jgi:hypothetical protein
MARVHRYRKVGAAVQSGNDPGRCSNLHMDILYEGDADEPSPDPPHVPPPLSPSERLNRVRAILDALRDALELDGRAYSKHLCTRAEVCDFIGEEIGRIVEGMGR